jgi:hypothetical protein
MKSKFYLVFILCLISNEYHLVTSNHSIQNHCFIQNKEKLFLYASSNHKFSSSSNLYLNTIDKLDDFNKIIWNIYRPTKSNNSFYIESSKYNEFLCINNLHKNLFGVRLVYQRIKIPNPFQTIFKNCLWDLEKVDLEKSKNSFVIKNKYYDQTLHSIPYFQDRKKSNNVGTFISTFIKRNSKKYIWNIICRVE